MAQHPVLLGMYEALSESPIYLDTSYLATIIDRVDSGRITLKTGVDYLIENHYVLEKRYIQDAIDAEERAIEYYLSRRGQD